MITKEKMQCGVEFEGGKCVMKIAKYWYNILKTPFKMQTSTNKKAIFLKNQSIYDPPPKKNPNTPCYYQENQQQKFNHQLLVSQKCKHRC